jgi:hypothetical protein
MLVGKAGAYLSGALALELIVGLHSKGKTNNISVVCLPISAKTHKLCKSYHFLWPNAISMSEIDFWLFPPCSFEWDGIKKNFGFVNLVPFRKKIPVI